MRKYVKIMKSLAADLESRMNASTLESRTWVEPKQKQQMKQPLHQPKLAIEYSCNRSGQLGVAEVIGHVADYRYWNDLINEAVTTFD